MKVTLVETSGLIPAVESLYISKNHVDKFYEILEDKDKFNEAVDKLFRYGQKHTTLLRFIDFTFLVEGMHRAGQDDWDSHAKRFANRIVRLSTRYSKFDMF